jgi:hypothetical protein
MSGANGYIRFKGQDILWGWYAEECYRPGWPMCDFPYIKESDDPDSRCFSAQIIRGPPVDAETLKELMRAVKEKLNKL